MITAQGATCMSSLRKDYLSPLCFFLLMKFILFIYLKTTRMKLNWKRVALYVLRVIELIITGAAGGAMTQL